MECTPTIVIFCCINGWIQADNATFHDEDAGCRYCHHPCAFRCLVIREYRDKRTFPMANIAISSLLTKFMGDFHVIILLFLAGRVSLVL